jgi:2-octaprenyl-6-methoxyphenol hydroxylase
VTTESLTNVDDMSFEAKAANDMTCVDIAIVGGAMAGSTLALGLSQLRRPDGQPLKIAVIEAHAPSQDHPGFDARSIAIAHGSVFELTKLNLWQHLAHLGTAIKHIHVSDRGHFGMTELNAQQFSLTAMGQVVELAKVGQVLFQQLQSQQNKGNIALYCPAALAMMTSEPEHHSLTLTTGEQLQAKLVVAADGGDSKVAEHFLLERKQLDFSQTALVANVVTDKPHQGWAFERFTGTGPLALLPMAPATSQAHASSRLSLVWALTPAKALALQQASKPEFLQALQAAFGHRAGRFVDVGERVSYPLTLSYLARPQYHRCLFVGNAAQTLHPIAGQGFNLGLRDVAALIEVIKDALSKQGSLDCGDTALLHQYTQGRSEDRSSTLTYIEFLVRGFSNQHWPLVAGRNLGLRLLSWCPPLKHQVAKRAMGWHRY